MRRAAALFSLLILILTAAPGALADGDPASDVLLGQDVFLPYSPISQAAQRRLYGVTAGARHAGYPLKVALIAARSDLGVVPALFGKPSQYARFLSAELSGVATGPVLVVMPTGIGLASRGNALSTAPLKSVTIGPGTDGLAAAGVAATERLTAAAGHPLPANVAGGSLPSAGAGPATIRHSLIAIGILGGLAAVALVGAAVARARHGAARTPRP